MPTRFGYALIPKVEWPGQSTRPPGRRGQAATASVRKESSRGRRDSRRRDVAPSVRERNSAGPGAGFPLLPRSITDSRGAQVFCFHACGRSLAIGRAASTARSRACASSPERSRETRRSDAGGDRPSAGADAHRGGGRTRPVLAIGCWAEGLRSDVAGRTSRLAGYRQSAESGHANASLTTRANRRGGSQRGRRCVRAH